MLRKRGLKHFLQINGISYFSKWAVAEVDTEIQAATIYTFAYSRVISVNDVLMAVAVRWTIYPSACLSLANHPGGVKCSEGETSWEWNLLSPRTAFLTM